MILYDHPMAPNPRRVRIYLAEKGIDVPLQTVDIMTGENRNSEFMEKNPVGSIPILELDDGTCIAESVAICRYFEALHPEPPMFGTTPAEIAHIDMWLRRVELNVMSTVGQVWIHGSPMTAPLFDQIEAAADFGRERAAMGFQLLDDQLAKTEFIAGDKYTIADAVAHSTMDFATGLVAMTYDDSLVNLKRWHDMVSARPSAQA